MSRATRVLAQVHGTIHSNSVNLGGLYSLKPWDDPERPVYMAHRTHNFVNLGKLYSLKPWQESSRLGPAPKDSPVGLPKKRVTPSGLPQTTAGTTKRPLNAELPHWAYFEDGSVFITFKRYNHSQFERIMSVLSHFVLGASEVEATLAMKRIYPDQLQMIIIEKDDLPAFDFQTAEELHVCARFARKRDTLFDPAQPFHSICVQLDSKNSLPVAIDMDDIPNASIEADWRREELTFSPATLKAFRGTLREGALEQGACPSTRLEILSRRTRRNKGEKKRKEELDRAASVSSSQHSGSEAQAAHPAHTISMPQPRFPQPGTASIFDKDVLSAHTEIRRLEQAKTIIDSIIASARQGLIPDTTHTSSIAAQLKPELPQKHNDVNWEKIGWDLEQMLAKANHISLETPNPSNPRTRQGTSSVATRPADSLQRARRSTAHADGAVRARRVHTDKAGDLLEADETLPTAALELLRKKNGG